MGNGINYEYHKSVNALKNGDCLKHYLEVIFDLNLEYNNRAELLQDIHHISFPFLTKLYIRSNRIQSVELLVDMQMPCL